jgi:hypothetical protein
LQGTILDQYAARQPGQLTEDNREHDRPGGARDLAVGRWGCLGHFSWDAGERRLSLMMFDELTEFYRFR